MEVGRLFSYGGNLPDQFKYAASYVDRILKGAKPAELPVEQPIQFDFASMMVMNHFGKGLKRSHGNDDFSELAVVL